MAWLSRLRTLRALRTPRILIVRRGGRLAAGVQARFCHLLADSAVFQEVGFLPFNQAVKQYIGLMYEDYGYIGNRFVGADAHCLAEICRIIVVHAYPSGNQRFFLIF